MTYCLIIVVQAQSAGDTVKRIGSEEMKRAKEHIGN